MRGLILHGTQDYLALLVRRKWWVLIPFIALSGAVILLTYILPRMYVSDTLILVRPRDVPNDFVRDLIAGTTEQRLTAIEQTVLSRTNLVQILHEFEDKLPEYRGLNMDQVVLKLRNEIKVTFQVENRGGVQLPLTYFRVSYQNQNPELAQKIATKLTSLFIEQDNRAREDQVFGTTEFLTAELGKVSEQQKKSEAKLKELKGRRRYELPDQLETNLRTLDRLGLQKQANGEALDRYATIRLNLERQISETPPVLPRQNGISPGPSAPIINPLVEEYRKKQAEYDQLSAKYNSKHPDVQSAKVQLERLKEKIPPEDLATAKKEAEQPQTGTVPNPVYQSLTNQLQEVKTEFDIREREKQWIDSEIGKYNNRVQNSPQSEQEIAEVLRQNTDLGKQSEDLKTKLSQAKLSESLESRQKGTQFVIVDPANYPLIPSKPSKPSIILVGALISLFVGIAIAIAVDIANQKIWTQPEIESLLGVPVLVEIPQIVTDSDTNLVRRKTFIRTASSLALSGAYSFCLYVMYVKQAAVLRLLEPMIHRFMY